MKYTEKTIHNIVEKQRKYFKTGVTLDVNWRIEQLKKLKNAVIEYENEFIDALSKDLGRSDVEAYLCDIGPIIVEINETIKGLKKWAKPEKHFSGLLCFPSIVTTVYKIPYGVSLIISPFNFPLLLTLGVLNASIAGGNTAVIKTSSKSKECTKILKKFIDETFDSNYVTLIDGGHDVADMCLAQNFDKIFYTGSPNVGKHVLTEAAKNLTSTALELGGEMGNWCIIRKDANLKDAARKIAFFKLCNAGQICININQIAVAKEIADDFIAELKNAFDLQITNDPINNPEYPKLINLGAYEKCEKIANQYNERIIYGGKGDKDKLKFEPTLIYPVKINEDIVTKELFCPLLPIVPYKDDEINKLLDVISDREKPLAFYLFTSDIAWANKIMQTMQYGGGCINEVCLHMMVKGVPFNGVGHSGMGAYHGKWGFDEFTHTSTVLLGKTNLNLPLREHPYLGKYKNLKMKLLKLFEK